MFTRICSGAVLLVLLIILFILGGPCLALTFMAVSIIGLYEFYKAVGVLSDSKKVDSLTLVGYAGTALLYIYLLISNADISYLIFAPVLVCIVMLTISVFTYPKYEATKVMYAVFGFCYVPLMLCFVYAIRALDNGIFLVWLIFFASWICDTFAYFTGVFLGKHKLAPKLSPKKSIEGSVGGIFFATLLAGVYGYFVKGYISGDFNVVLAFAVVGAVGSIVSQVGDLAASAIKRYFDIKDYGNLIPGHGGIMDRFDSMITTAPMIYLVTVIFTKLVG